MKKILLSLAALCCWSIVGVIANDSTSFIKAVLRKTVICSPDSSVETQGSVIILTLDSNMNKSDRIGLVQGDTTFFLSGIDTNQVTFDLDSFPLFCVDSLDSVLTVNYVVPTQRIDTFFNISYVKNDVFLTTESRTKYSGWIWWTIGGASLLLVIVAGLFLFIYLQKKKKVATKTDEDSSEEHGNETTDDTISNGQSVSQNPPTNKEIERLNKLVDQLKAEKETAKKKAEDEAEKNMTKAQKKWDETKAKQDKNIEELTTKLNQEKEKVKTIRNEVAQEKQLIIDKLQESLDHANNDLNSVKKSLSETKTQLQKTQDELSTANTTIEYLDESQKQYSAKITFAPYAEKYALLIKKIFELETKLTERIVVFSKKDLSDPYHMFKATHRFMERLSEVDMDKFRVEVEMASKKQMTFTGNGIAHLSTLQGAEQVKQVRAYFVLNYLAKYVAALQIYVESLIGLHKLMEDVSPADVLEFKNIRQQLITLYEQMEIKVICPQLFDSIGNNMDLRVEQVDAGFESGDILEIMNCLVYSVDGQTPTDKIYVKAQQ